MSIQYLNTSTQMKIRPVSDENVLFEMETNEFMTTCCRVNTSYDLVVRDITSGAMLFCISGAEIEDHPLDVYISDDHHIARIKDKVGYVHFGDIDAVQIQESSNWYTLNSSTVRVTPGLITLKWPQGLTKEFKALSIAFALHIAMTKHKGRVFGRAPIRSTTPVDARYPSLLPSTQSEACPRNNRSTPVSVFRSCDHEQEFWLKELGWQHDNECSTAVLINKDDKRVVLHLTGTRDKGNRAEIVKAIDINGKEEFTSVWPKEPSRMFPRFVKYNEQKIGQFSFDSTTREFSLIIFEKECIREISTRTPGGREGIFKEFVDCSDNSFGALDAEIPRALHIKFAAGITPVLKKIIICVSNFYFGSWMKVYNYLPIIRMSRLSCNCDYCHRPETVPRKRDHPFFELLYTDMRYRMTASGHNRQRNVVLYSIYADRYRYVHCTLEVTPVKDFLGVAKVQCRDSNGFIIFTAIHYENDSIVAIYDNHNKFMAYMSETSIYGKKGNKIWSIIELPKGRNYDESRFGPNVQYYIKDLDTNVVSMISSDWCVISVLRPRTQKKTPTKFQVIIELTLAAILNSYSYEFDRTPTPEILQCYHRPAKMKFEKLF